MKSAKLIVPQANSWITFDAIFDLVAQGISSHESIGEHLEMTPRAVAYYTQLGQWLGFFDRGELSALGHRYRLDDHDKSLAAKSMLSHEWFDRAVDGGPDLSLNLLEILSEISTLSDATIARRISGLVKLWTTIPS